jgi:hypothetical protein
MNHHTAQALKALITKKGKCQSNQKRLEIFVTAQQEKM